MNGGMDYVRILRDLREDADKTQTQIAEVLGTSQTMYARYERGANELPIHHLITLSKYYGVSTDYLLGLSKERWKRGQGELPVRVFPGFFQSAGAISCAFASTTLLSSASGRSAVSDLLPARSRCRKTL